MGTKNPTFGVQPNAGFDGEIFPNFQGHSPSNVGEISLIIGAKLVKTNELRKYFSIKIWILHSIDF